MLGAAKQSLVLASASASAPSNGLLAVGSSGTPNLNVYEYIDGTLTRLSDPATMPSNIVYDVSWSPISDVLACVGVTTRFLAYWYDNGSLTKIADPATLPTSTCYSVDWHPDGNMLAIGTSASAGAILVYTWDGSTFTQVSEPLNIAPTTNIYKVKFSPDGTRLIAVGQRTTFGSIGTHHEYSVSGTSFTRIGVRPPTATYAYAADFSPDSNYVAFGSNSSFSDSAETGNVLQIHKYDATDNLYDDWLSSAIDTQPPVNTVRNVSYTTDGSDLLAVAHYVSPYVSLYQRSGESYTKLSDPDTLPSSNGFSVDWLNGGEVLAVGHQSSPYVSVYTRSGTALTKISDPATLPVGTAYGVSWRVLT